MRVNYGVSIVSKIYELCSVSIIAVQYAISCYTGLHYNGTLFVQNPTNHLVQEYNISIVNALAILQFCTKPEKVDLETPETLVSQIKPSISSSSENVQRYPYRTSHIANPYPLLCAPSILHLPTLITALCWQETGRAFYFCIHLHQINVTNYIKCHQYLPKYQTIQKTGACATKKFPC